MTKQENKVAIFFGSFSNKNDFQEFMKVHYELLDEVDDVSEISSNFEKEFHIVDCDRDLVEMAIQDKNASYRALLKNASYLAEYSETLSDEATKYNLVILIYDYKFAGKPSRYEKDSNFIDFFKNIPYKKEVDVSKWLV